MEDLLDSIPQENKNKAILKKRRIIILILLGTLTIANFLMAPIGFEKRPMFGPGGEDRIIGLLTIGVASYGFILGLLLALIPFRRFSFKQKYITAALFGMCIVQSLMTTIIAMNVFYF